MANISVPCAETLTQCLATPGIDKTQCLYNIVTPYDPLAWGISLCESRLLYSFPCLIFDLKYGAPISNPPPLTHTFIPANLKSAEFDTSYMDRFMATEVASGQIDGPFTVPQVHTIFGGHFYTAPLGLVEKLGSPLADLESLQGRPPWQIHKNGWINTSVSAMKYFSAADTADFVSLIFVLYIFSHSPTSYFYIFQGPTHSLHGGHSQFSIFILSVYAVEAWGTVSCMLAS